MTQEPAADRAFVLGLDGIPWELIDRWTAAGELPNFASILEEGTGGELESSQPATTPVAWPAIATGTGPDRHGVYGFVGVTDSYAPDPYDSTDIQRPALWDMVSPSVVGNVPMTHPPSDIDGKMVTGMITPNLDAGFASPSTLEDRIRSEIPDYDISLNWLRYRDDPDSLVEDLDVLFDARREMMRLLMDTDEWRLFFFVYTAPDRLQHLFWEEEVLLDHYRRLDDLLGEVQSYCLERDANLFVVSDHGFGPVDRTVNVNRILEREGFLAREESGGAKSVLRPFGITKSRVKDLVRLSGLEVKRLLTLLPERAVNSVANSIPGNNVLYDIDRSRTTAFMHGPGYVFINATDRFVDGTVDPADRESVKRDLLRTLPRVRDPETGERMLDVHDGAALFPAHDDAPDLVVEPRAKYDLRSKLASEAVERAGTKAGDHRSEGLFMAWGPDIEPDGMPGGATVFDVAPTVLHALGEPIPETRAGEPMVDIFGETSLGDRETVTTATYTMDEEREASDATGDFAEVEERLRGLGYVE